VIRIVEALAQAFVVVMSRASESHLKETIDNEIPST
jgi:hypothetical protein